MVLSVYPRSRNASEIPRSSLLKLFVIIDTLSFQGGVPIVVEGDIYAIIIASLFYKNGLWAANYNHSFHL